MLNEGREFIRAAAWVTTYPGLAHGCFRSICWGDGLRDILLALTVGLDCAIIICGATWRLPGYPLVA